MAQMRTTYGNGGITTRTSPPPAGPPQLFDGGTIAAMLMERLRQRQAKDNQPAPQPYQVPMEAPRARPAAEPQQEPYYVKMAGNGPNQTPGYVEVGAGEPGAVFGGYRPARSGGGGAPRVSGGGDAGLQRASLDDPMDNYIQRQAAARQQQDDGRYAQAVPGTSYGVDLLR